MASVQQSEKTAVTGSNVHGGITASLNGFRTSERKKTAVTGANVHGGITASLNGFRTSERKKNGRDGRKCAWWHNCKPEWRRSGRAKKNRTKRIALF